MREPSGQGGLDAPRPDQGCGADARTGALAVDAELARLRHDLRTPLAIVAGFGELLASDRRLDEEARRDYARRVVDAAEELRRMIEGSRPLR